MILQGFVSSWIHQFFKFTFLSFGACCYDVFCCCLGEKSKPSLFLNRESEKTFNKITWVYISASQKSVGMCRRWKKKAWLSDVAQSCCTEWLLMMDSTAHYPIEVLTRSRYCTSIKAHTPIREVVWRTDGGLYGRIPFKEPSDFPMTGVTSYSCKFWCFTLLVGKSKTSQISEWTPTNRRQAWLNHFFFFFQRHSFFKNEAVLAHLKGLNFHNFWSQLNTVLFSYNFQSQAVAPGSVSKHFPKKCVQCKCSFTKTERYVKSEKNKYST